MRLIVKGVEAPTVRDTRLASTTSLATRDSAQTAYGQCDKQQVRDHLAREQGYLCAFCMREIEPAPRFARPVTMKIAHRTPIAVRPQFALTWTNLLGACDGGQRGDVRTCDTAQGSTALAVDPTNRASIDAIAYEARPPRRGLFVTAADPALCTELGGDRAPDGSPRRGVLGLNGGDLPELRSLAWDAFRLAFRARHPGRPAGKPELREFLPRFVAERAPRLPEMLGVIEAKLR